MEVVIVVEGVKVEEDVWPVYSIVLSLVLSYFPSSTLSLHTASLSAPSSSYSSSSSSAIVTSVLIVPVLCNRVTFGYGS
ncbi:hypothetical protein E2C01_083884 [Portunus trituberculatus]|uniref:Uncharacterized protein n=1 Tax=Portunus trituberculatus TaxID=210409 RepID=A0A5B7J608_PORTR|nr:hypothetical protein [Portunus trituberculatus]